VLYFNNRALGSAAALGSPDLELLENEKDDGALDMGNFGWQTCASGHIVSICQLNW
jgi:hypothetical protein